MAASVLDVLSSTARRLLQRPAPIAPVLGEATTSKEVSMLTEETFTQDLQFQNQLGEATTNWDGAPTGGQANQTGANKANTGAV